MLSPLSRQKIWKLTNLSSDGICNWSISTNQSILVCLVRSYIIQPLMNPFTVEEFYEFSKTFSQFFFAVIVAQKNPFIFQSPPCAFHEDVVLAPAYSVHADFNIVGLKQFNKGSACILRAAVRVEDCRNSIRLKCFLHTFHAEINLHVV